MGRGLLFAVAAVAALAAVAPAHASPTSRVEVVATLDAPSLARAVASSRVFTTAAKRRRLDLRAPTSTAYLRDLDTAQRALEARIERAIPTAQVRWRYAVVLNGLAIVLPAGRVDELAVLPGVARVYESVRYRARLDRTPQLIAAPTLWGPSFTTAGQGVKIGIVDDGLDQSHPFFDPRGYAMPPGFPKGNAAFTTAKVIAARAFPPPSPKWRHAAKPFDPEESDHATHVAGIAAGNNGATAAGRARVSGIAPRAYLGNYKVLTIPTASDVGLDGNAPEIAAGIEAAVRDGMDVINLSLGEPEIEPTRDLVVQAIDAAADAGVVPVVAAGNDFGDVGAGSISSPGSAAKAITTGAATKSLEIADFSAGAPTPISLRLKPDVVAPGASVLSSVPVRSGSWASFSGTSMAAPHVAGAAALLLQRHPQWTPAQVKAALALTAEPLDGVAPARQGGGLVNLVRADAPLIFATPTAVSFGHITAAATPVTRTIELADAGGGAGAWAVSVQPHTNRIPAGITTPPTVTVPGSLTVSAAVRAGVTGDLPIGDADGWIVLTRGQERRRIPYWLFAGRPNLGPPTTTLSRTGTYRGNTRGRPARVSEYRYPADPSGAGVTTRLAGSEQVFRVRVARPVANFGVAVLSRRRGVRVEARVVVAGNEYRQVGYTSLPINLNPYLPSFLRPRLVSGAVRPARGDYDVVFDSPTRDTAGAFTFRFWLHDTTPPSIRLLTSRVAPGGTLRVSVRDRGSGVDPESLLVSVDGAARVAAFRGGVLRVRLGRLHAGRHRLVVQASDYQETRNMENVPPILPNTRRVSIVFRVS